MDEIDRAILRTLRDDARISFRDLGETVGLSANAVADRVRRLVSAGTIRRFRAEIDPSAGVPAASRRSTNAMSREPPALGSISARKRRIVPALTRRRTRSATAFALSPTVSPRSRKLIRASSRSVRRIARSISSIAVENAVNRPISFRDQYEPQPEQGYTAAMTRLLALALVFALLGGAGIAARAADDPARTVASTAGEKLEAAYVYPSRALRRPVRRT